MISKMDHIIFDDVSLELLPKKFLNSREARSVFQSFKVEPHSQILDQNYHPHILRALNDRERRGRPDVVHFALLDVTSAPIFLEGNVRVFIHTRDNVTIEVKKRTRLPRTLNRFCGVMSKILSDSIGKEEESLFDVQRGQTFGDLISTLGCEKVIAFSRTGKSSSLKILVQSHTGPRVAWVIGGFAHGHLGEKTISLADMVVSISSFSLPAHVVSSRLAYEMEIRV